LPGPETRTRATAASFFPCLLKLSAKSRSTRCHCECAPVFTGCRDVVDEHLRSRAISSLTLRQRRSCFGRRAWNVKSGTRVCRPNVVPKIGHRSFGGRDGVAARFTGSDLLAGCLAAPGIGGHSFAVFRFSSLSFEQSLFSLSCRIPLFRARSATCRLIGYVALFHRFPGDGSAIGCETWYVAAAGVFSVAELSRENPL